MPRTSSAEGRTALVLVPLSTLSGLKDLQKQDKQDLEKLIGGSHRMVATSDSRCPVRYLERLISKRPQHLRNSGPLQKAGVSNDKIIAITGHKTEQSIKAYVDTDLEDVTSVHCYQIKDRWWKTPYWLMHNPGMYHIPLLHSLGSTIVVFTLGAHVVHHRLITL